MIGVGGAGGSVCNVAPILLVGDTSPYPIRFLAETLTDIAAFDIKLKGVDLKVVNGIVHSLLVLIAELLPSQLAVYSNHVLAVLESISILYAVIGRPLSLGKLHYITKLRPTTDVVGSRGASGAFAE